MFLRTGPILNRESYRENGIIYNCRNSGRVERQFDHTAVVKCYVHWDNAIRLPASKVFEDRWINPSGRIENYWIGGYIEHPEAYGPTLLITVRKRSLL